MGLFDKKYCDVCGEKIGLLGNRKLEDGNLCKNCAKKLSPFFNERRSSTVDEIKQQLAYREENKRQLAYFNPTRTLGTDEKVYVDEINRSFIVTSSSNWRDRNPDIIEISQVTSCNVDIRENREEIMHTDNQGNEVSYNPPRYKYEYIFNVEITVDSPWFSEISFELTDYENRPDSRYTDIYSEYEHQADELKRLLMPDVYGNQQFSGQNFQQNNQMNCQTPFCEQHNVYQGQGYQQPKPGYQQQMGIINPSISNQYENRSIGMTWVCPSCATHNTGKFCSACGYSPTNQQPVSNNSTTGVNSYRCDKCGWIPSDPQNIPKFCPQCGDVFDFNDVK